MSYHSTAHWKSERSLIKWLPSENLAFKTLQRHLLVSQDEPLVEMFTRDSDSGWQHSFVAGLVAPFRNGAI